MLGPRVATLESHAAPRTKRFSWGDSSSAIGTSDLGGRRLLRLHLRLRLNRRGTSYNWFRGWLKGYFLSGLRLADNLGTTLAAEGISLSDLHTAFIAGQLHRAHPFLPYLSSFDREYLKVDGPGREGSCRSTHQPDNLSIANDWWL